MHAQPQQQHKWLEQLLGQWTFEHEASCNPDQPKEKFTGRESVRSLGGLWMICEGQGNMPGGGTANMIMTLGYDPARERFLGTFVGSMFTHLWLYEGTLDAAQKVLTPNTEGPSFAPGTTGMAKYQDIIEFISPDHRTLTSRMLGPNGDWTTFMQAHYRRL